MNILIIFIITLVVHEIGHYISFLSFGIRPDIKLTWFGIVIGSKVYHKLIPLKAYFVNISGILCGAIVLQYFHVSTEYWLGYLLMCMIDIVNILGIMDIEKKDYDKSLLEIAEIRIRELKREEEVRNA